MEQWEIDLLNLHLARWFEPADLDVLYQSERPATSVAAELATYDFQFFLKYYLRHYFSQEWAICHLEVTDDLAEAVTNDYPDVLAESLPRGFGKSTLVCVGLVLWSIIGEDLPGVYGENRTPRKHYVIVAKDSFDQSKLELSSVKYELEENEKLKRDFGDFVGAPWGAAEMVTSNEVRVDALGTGQKIRGRRHAQYRPDLVILDDLENDQTVRSPTQRLKVKQWISRAVEKAGDPRSCDYIFIGTHLHYDCAQAWISARPGVRSRKYRALISHADNQELWDEWQHKLFDLFDQNREQTARQFYLDNEAEMLAGVEVSWKERFPYYTLRLMLAGEQADAQGQRIKSFSAEMQNEPIDEEDRLFKTIKYWHWEQAKGHWYLVPDDYGHRVHVKTCLLVGACDPSLGESHDGAYSAVIEIMVAPNGMMFCVHADIQRRHPDRIIDYIQSRVQYWLERGRTFSAFAIETVQFQKLFASKTGQDLLSSGYRLPIVEVRSSSNKNARIDSLQPDLHNGYLRLLKEQSRTVPEEQFLLYEQLWQYPMGQYVDGPDALEMARSWAAPTRGITKGQQVVADTPFSAPARAADPFRFRY
jgi:predicted phage terminase large subunit-like protein